MRPHATGVSKLGRLSPRARAPDSGLQQIQEVFQFQQNHLASMLKKAGGAIKQRDREIAELRSNVQQLQCQVCALVHGSRGSLPR